MVGRTFFYSRSIDNLITGKKYLIFMSNNEYTMVTVNLVARIFVPPLIFEFITMLSFPVNNFRGLFKTCKISNMLIL